MPSILENIGALNAQLANLPPATVVAVSKTFPAGAVQQAAAGGMRHFGENYLQEAEGKMAACAKLSPPPVWHFLGSVQGNKTARVAKLFSWVHSVDRLQTAKRLSAARDKMPPLNIFLQVNIDDENSKAGAAAADAPALAAQLAALPNLRLRGLMALPAPDGNRADAFCRVVALQRDIIKSGVRLDCLSLGMSGDFPLALAAGATHIRVGTAIFGKREQKKIK